MSLKNEISQWDGKSADEINRIFNLHCDRSGFIADLLGLIKTDEYQQGATWLLKAWLEKGKSFDSKQSAKVLTLLPSLTHWQSKLHVLQCLPFIVIDKKHKTTVELFCAIR